MEHFFCKQVRCPPIHPEKRSDYAAALHQLISMKKKCFRIKKKSFHSTENSFPGGVTLHSGSGSAFRARKASSLQPGDSCPPSGHAHWKAAYRALRGRLTGSRVRDFAVAQSSHRGPSPVAICLGCVSFVGGRYDGGRLTSVFQPTAEALRGTGESRSTHPRRGNRVGPGSPTRRTGARGRRGGKEASRLRRARGRIIPLRRPVLG
jgi:hypothetical protein